MTFILELTYSYQFVGQSIRDLEPEKHIQTLDLDIDPVTLIYENDLDILKLYLRTKNELSR